MNKILIVLLAALPLSAFAHGDKIEMTVAGVNEAVKSFKKDLPDQIAKFTGVKGWLAADKMMAKIYLSGTPTDVTYTCTMMEMGPGKDDMITCVK
jgi:hypothetical protein